MKRAVILLGGGGHAKVLADALILRGVKILGYVDVKKTGLKMRGKEIKYLGSDETLLTSGQAKKVHLVNGVGSTKDTSIRKSIYLKFKKSGWSFEAVVHPSAVLSPDVTLSEGAQVMAGAILQAGAVIGDNVIINTGASVDHDCVVEAHAHIAPRAVLAGSVRVCEGVHVGMGSLIKQNVTVEKFVRMGSVIT